MIESVLTPYSTPAKMKELDAVPVIQVAPCKGLRRENHIMWQNKWRVTDNR